MSRQNQQIHSSIPCLGPFHDLAAVARPTNTKQALKLFERLSKTTALPPWIDAICIPQDNPPIKMQELAKMADIYRVAVAVICLVPEVSSAVSDTVKLAKAVMKSEIYASKSAGGDIYGSYMYATCNCGGSSVLRDLFASRWWERAWTFQEALLNTRTSTFLVGDTGVAVSISDWLALVGPASPRLTKPTLGRPASFWDSLAKMMKAADAERRLSLGDVMSCVWRRNATVPHDMVYALLGVCGLSEQIRPDYGVPIRDVLIRLFESASLKGDYLWIVWCQEYMANYHEQEDGRLRLVPAPENVRAVPFMRITKWTVFPPLQLKVLPGAKRDILVPFKSTGTVRW
ncbi:heterokaryon incompatibility protein-domain-containing protein [Geopyxis carbonaria]|nr:heterokaryon incompatibility protein-domain-containing protein [Geopyxis carbonaria]